MVAVVTWVAEAILRAQAGCSNGRSIRSRTLVSPAGAWAHSNRVWEDKVSDGLMSSLNIRERLDHLDVAFYERSVT